MKDEVKKRVLDYFYNPSNREHILLENYMPISVFGTERHDLYDLMASDENFNELFEKFLYSNDLGLLYIMPSILRFLNFEHINLKLPKGYRKVSELERDIHKNGPFDFDVSFDSSKKKFVYLNNYSFFFIANNNPYIIMESGSYIKFYSDIDIDLLRSLFLKIKINTWQLEPATRFYEEFRKLFEKNLILEYRIELLKPKETKVSLKQRLGIHYNFIDIVVPEYSDDDFINDFHVCKMDKSIVKDLNLFCREEIKIIKELKSQEEAREQKRMEERWSEDNFS